MATSSDISLLAGALLGQFSESEAEDLARLIDASLDKENIYYEEIPLPEQKRNDCLLTAWEDRILIPVRSQQAGGWDDKVLTFAPGEMFFMTRTTRVLFQIARSTGSLDSESAVRRVFSNEKAPNVDDSILFLKSLRKHVHSCMAEGGVMAAVARGAGIEADVHDIVDTCVVAGIMSPCTRGSSFQGLVWYEVLPILYWDERFA